MRNTWHQALELIKETSTDAKIDGKIPMYREIDKGVLLFWHIVCRYIDSLVEHFT